VSNIPNDLAQIYSKVKDGQSPTTTVITLLSWFGASRRSRRNVALIRRTLEQLGLETEPDFESLHIDATIKFQNKPMNEATTSTSNTATTTTTTPAPRQSSSIVIVADHVLTDRAIGVETASIAKLAEPAHQISRLKSANTPPIWVKPDSKVGEAITIMLANDFSQLPVMQSEREPKGMFSWRSLGSRLAMGRNYESVRECMEEYKELGPGASLYDAIPLIVQYDCVLVRDASRKICGVVTPADVSAQFQELAEPFLLLGAIENHLRSWISARFQKEDLQEAKDPEDKERIVNDASDLTFGEYIRLLENPIKWERLKTAIDRKVFIDLLDKVRTIRNDVMHFDPDPMDPADLSALRSFAQFLERLQDLEKR
jgi:CBS domain-containing protein